MNVEPKNISNNTTLPAPADLAEALGGRRIIGGWIACCPAHDDRWPSLSIGIKRDGTPLLHCFAGCDFLDIVAALRARGLWPEPTRQQRHAARWCHSIAEIDRTEMVLAIAVADLRKGLTLGEADRKAVRAAWALLREAGHV